MQIEASDFSNGQIVYSLRYLNDRGMIAVSDRSTEMTVENVDLNKNSVFAYNHNKYGGNDPHAWVVEYRKLDRDYLGISNDPYCGLIAGDEILFPDTKALAQFIERIDLINDFRREVLSQSLFKLKSEDILNFKQLMD